MREEDLMATGQRRALAATLLVVAVTLGHDRGLDTEPEPSEHPNREWTGAARRKLRYLIVCFISIP